MVLHLNGGSLNPSVTGLPAAHVPKLLAEWWQALGFGFSPNFRGTRGNCVQHSINDNGLRWRCRVDWRRLRQQNVRLAVNVIPA
jgi:hypothetical protein